MNANLRHWSLWVVRWALCWVRRAPSAAIELPGSKVVDRDTQSVQSSPTTDRHMLASQARVTNTSAHHTAELGAGASSNIPVGHAEGLDSAIMIPAMKL